MSGKHLSEIQAVSRLIDEGAIERARARVEEIAARKLSRQEKLALARAARRSHLPQRAALLLNRIVRPTGRSSSGATDAERAEYGMSLVQLGATREGLEIIEGVDFRREPQALKYFALAHFRIWDWEAGTALVEQYMRTAELTPWLRVDMSTTLAAGLMFGAGDLDAAAVILEEALAETGSPDFRILHYDALQLLCNLQILKGQWKEAARSQRQVAEFAAHAGDPRIALKARFLERLLKLHVSADRAAAGEMTRMRDEFRAHGYWEFARNCDFEIGSKMGDSGLLQRVYFGSPYPACRRKLLRSFGTGKLILPEHYSWELAPENGRPSAHFVSAGNGENDLGPSYLKEGQLPQRTLRALCSDFYKPLRMAELHAMIYPDSYFNPTSSLAQVHQAIQRLRSWFAETGLPLEVRQENELYWLESKEGCRILVPLPPDPGLPAENPAAAPVKLKRLLEQLRNSLKDAEFSAALAASVLRIPRRSCVRHLKAAKDLGLLAQEGSGPSARYRFV